MFIYLRFFIKGTFLVKVVCCPLFVKCVIIGFPVFKDFLVLDEVIHKFFLAETVLVLIFRSRGVDFNSAL